LAARTETEKRLHRLLKHDLGKAVSRTKRGTWTTTSNLPHEIRLHTQAGVELVRISAGIVIDTEPSKKLLVEMNRLNAERAFSRRILIDGKVLVVAELPVASLHEGDLENLVSMVCCFARLDADALAEYGGRPVTDPPAAFARSSTRHSTTGGTCSEPAAPRLRASSQCGSTPSPDATAG